MTDKKEKVRWGYNPIINCLVVPSFCLMVASWGCILMNWVVWNTMDVNVDLPDFLYAPWQLRGSVAYDTASGFQVDNIAWLFARPWVGLSIYLGLGLLILNFQLAWIPKNEDLLERLFISPSYRKLSFWRMLRAEIVRVMPFLPWLFVTLLSTWFYTFLPVLMVIFTPQFFLYKDLNRIYQKAKENVAKL